MNGAYYLDAQSRKVVVTEPGVPSVHLPTGECVVNHSCGQFDWGYVGSGPAQLAFAMCLHHLDLDAELALAVYHHVLHHLVANIDKDSSVYVTRDVLNDCIMNALDGLGTYMPTPEALAADPRGRSALHEP